MCDFIPFNLLPPLLERGFPDSSVGKESACNGGDPCWIPGLGRSTREGIGYPLQYSWASFVAQLIKNPPAMRRSWFDPWVRKIPWRREWLSTPVFWPGEFHGQYSPWGLKESDMSEPLSLSLSAREKLQEDVKHQFCFLLIPRAPSSHWYSIMDLWLKK